MLNPQIFMWIVLVKVINLYCYGRLSTYFIFTAKNVTAPIEYMYILLKDLKVVFFKGVIHEAL